MDLMEIKSTQTRFYWGIWVSFVIIISFVSMAPVGIGFLPELTIKDWSLM